MHAGYRITRVNTAKFAQDLTAHEALAASVRRSITKECAQRVRVAKARRAKAMAEEADQPKACLTAVPMFDPSLAYPTKSVARNREWASIYAQAMNVFLDDMAHRLDPYAGEPVEPPKKKKKRVRFLLPSAWEVEPARAFVYEPEPELEPEPALPIITTIGLPRGLDEIIRSPLPKKVERRPEQPFVTEMRACLAGGC